MYKYRMSNASLFGDTSLPPSESEPGKEPARALGRPRLRTANRSQVEWAARDLESCLPEDDRARLLWALVERLDLTIFYDRIEARGAVAGAPAADPKILLTLWLLATSEGISSGKWIAKLCDLHDSYRWICGGVRVDPHTLTDFRSEGGEGFDSLLTEVLALLLKQGVLTLDRVAQDGMRVRASAGAASFRRGPTLEECLKTAREHVAAVALEASRPESQWSQQQRAARERGARERLERVESALRELPAVREAKRGREEKSPPRVSTTDPQARVMKHADGGFRPSYNVNFATDTKSRVVVGVLTNNLGSDRGLILPMLDAIEARTGKTPPEYLLDGGYVKNEDFEKLARMGVTAYAPVPKPRKPNVDPHAPKQGDGPATIAWRARMTTDPAKQIYKERAATAETLNAEARVKLGLSRLTVRGVAKVTSVALLVALTHNLLLEVTAKAFGLV
jgi:transposase